MQLKLLMTPSPPFANDVSSEHRLRGKFVDSAQSPLAMPKVH